MKKRQLSVSILTLAAFSIFVFSSCKKINEATDLGGGLIPPIDNINTFDTIITVEAYNDIFPFTGNPLLNDSARTSRTDEQFLGLISNDPFFGRTDARMFFEMKPPFYKYTFLNIPHPDSLFIDSVVLVLDYVETYGDSTVPQTIEVREITSEFRFDTLYLLRENNLTTGALLGSRTIVPQSLKDSVKAYKDTTKNQLRIRLDDSFGERLLMYDTAGANNAYSSDSAFKEKFKGFALQSVAGGNAVMGFNLMGGNSKLAIYYKYANEPDDLDTTVAYFPFAANSLSAAANYVTRDYSGTPLMAAQGGATPDPILYIQNTPGTFATIKTPDLVGLSNRVVHRAELIAEQVYDISDSMFAPPPYLYLDAYDPDLDKYRTIPYDVLFTSATTLNLDAFGIIPANSIDENGKTIKTWRFNITRYVQHIVNGTEDVYDLRLSSPFYFFNQYKPTPASVPTTQPISINPTTTKGRVRIAGNTGPGDTNPHRMRIRIIYSKL